MYLAVTLFAGYAIEHGTNVIDDDVLSPIPLPYRKKEGGEEGSSTSTFASKRKRSTDEDEDDEEDEVVDIDDVDFQCCDVKLADLKPTLDRSLNLLSMIMSDRKIVNLSDMTRINEDVIKRLLDMLGGES